MLDRQEGSSLLEDVVIVGGLLLAQCVLAAYVVFIDHLLGLGAHPLAVIVVAGVASAAFFLPFAIALERHEPVACHRTAAISSKPAMPPYMGLLLLHFTFLILNTCVPRTDAVGDREDDAGSRLRSAMPNLSPGLIFIVAACFRRIDRSTDRCDWHAVPILSKLLYDACSPPILGNLKVRQGVQIHAGQAGWDAGVPGGSDGHELPAQPLFFFLS
ncbi:hypothetical protein GQ55_4G367400 [Panicum hallii var. hallii]|uniref:Uncharacterized protein n=1 Tax=Panicum hallii var. hallii TaxID=1504633 RepID=A0A2T7E3X9_9POAL|nr:hypothetical protein GQ55_4G367400 [Panicum hallii var. hallii]